MGVVNPQADQKAIKFSIIIPVYNAENFLSDTFESILAQDFNKDLYEVIAIDDGSMDSSLQIIHDFEKRFPNFKYLTQPNSGVSVARNKALGLVSGEYVLFLDSDDTLKEKVLHRVSDVLDNNDSEVYFFDTSYPSQLVKYDRDRFLSEVYFPVYVWKTCIKSQLIRDNDLRFSEGYVLEDGVFLLETIIKASEIATLNLDLVSYNFNEKSLMRDYSDKRKNLRMISSFVFIINKYHHIINNIKDSVSLKTYHNLMERKESFIFFMFFRMVRYKLSNREIEENLEKVHFNAFTAFPGTNHKRILYKGLAPLMENRPFRNLFNAAYKLVKMEVPPVHQWIKRETFPIHAWGAKNVNA